MITLEANYSKKLGLPGYSSHQYSLTIRKEISDVSQVEAESRQLYSTLQQNVDRDIQSVGFLPSNGKSKTNGNHHPRTNGHANGNGSNEMWACSIAQKNCILGIVEENRLDKNEIETMAREMFEGTGVKFLNTMQASQLIKELIAKYPRQERNGGYHRRSYQRTRR